MLESERLRVRRRARVRATVALGLLVVLSVSFSQLFLPGQSTSSIRAGARSEEQLVFHLATAVAYGGAHACMRRWSASRGSAAVLVGAVTTACGIAGCAWWWVTATLSTERDPGRPTSWWRVMSGARPPAVGPEAVAMYRPGLVVLLVIVLPVVVVVWDAALTFRERTRLEAVEDGIALGASAPALPPSTTEQPPGAAPPGHGPCTAPVGHVGRLPPPIPGTRARPAAPGARGSTAEPDLRGDQPLVRTDRRRRARARLRFRLTCWTILAVHLGVYATALPHRQTRTQPSLSSTVHSLATLFATLAAFLLLHLWARTRTASPGGMVAALLATGAVAAAGWWLTMALVGAASSTPDGLDHLRDPDVMATYGSLLRPPLLVAQGSWQQAALVALGFLVPLVLATWDARSDRAEWERLRRLEQGRDAAHQALPTVTPAAWTPAPHGASSADPWADGR